MQRQNRGLTLVKVFLNFYGFPLNIAESRKMRAFFRLDDIRAYDAAKNSEDEIMPFEQAVQEIESYGC